MKRCDSNEHYFDDNKHSSCPFCLSDRESNDKTKVFGKGGNNNTSDNTVPVYNNNSDGKTQTVPVYNNAASSNNQEQNIPDEKPTPTPSTSDAPKTQVNWGKKKTTKTQESDNNTSTKEEESNQELTAPVVGWLVIIKGNGLGNDLKIIPGMNTIGRDDTNNISIDFGDMSISRSKHCSLIFDYKNNLFFLAHSEGGNLSYLNDGVVLQPINLKAGDIIGIGDTKLKFIPFCNEDFCWDL